MAVMNTVAILVSTYNGQQYISEQLDSLLLQKGVSIVIIVRDDGSKDGTIQILEDYEKRYSDIKVIKDENRGVLYSFTELCKYALENVEADYYAFCDQDDVWDSDKLSIAVSKIDKYPSNESNLYFSNARLVDKNLDYIRDLYEPGEIKIGKKMALVQIPTFGCTCVFNRHALIDFLAIPNQKQGHDHWIYLVCTYLGNVYYDEDSHIDYRQHGNNASGKKERGIKLVLLRLHTLFVYGLNHNFDEKAQQLLYYKDRLKPDDLAYIKKVAYYRKHILDKMSLLFSRSYSTGDFMKDLTIKIRILVNRL